MSSASVVYHVTYATGVQVLVPSDDGNILSRSIAEVVMKAYLLGHFAQTNAGGAIQQRAVIELMDSIIQWMDKRRVTSIVAKDGDCNSLTLVRERDRTQQTLRIYLPGQAVSQMRYEYGAHGRCLLYK